MALPWFVSPSIVFSNAELAVDIVLLLCEHEHHDHEHDQRALRGHVEAERKTEHRNGDLIQRVDEHVDDVAEEKPDPEMHEHQVGGLLPVGFIVFGCSHGLVALPAIPGPFHGTGYL